MLFFQLFVCKFCIVGFHLNQFVSLVTSRPRSDGWTQADPEALRPALAARLLGGNCTKWRGTSADWGSHFRLKRVFLCLNSRQAGKDTHRRVTNSKTWIFSALDHNYCNSLDVILEASVTNATNSCCSSLITIKCRRRNFTIITKIHLKGHLGELSVCQSHLTFWTT